MSRFVVIDSDGFTSSDEDGTPQTYETFDEAKKRATNAALGSPGEEIGVFGLIATVEAPVGEVVCKKRCLELAE